MCALCPPPIPTPLPPPPTHTPPPTSPTYADLACGTSNRFFNYRGSWKDGALRGDARALVRALARTHVFDARPAYVAATPRFASIHLVMAASS